MKSHLISALLGILILQISISYYNVDCSPVGIQKRTEKSPLEPEIATTNNINQARQEGGEETTARTESEEDEEEDEDTPTPTESSAPKIPAPTTRRPPLPVQLNSTFNQEYNLVLANQNQFQAQKQQEVQIKKEIEAQVVKEFLKNQTETETENKTGTGAGTEAETGTGTGTETETKGEGETEGGDTDADNETGNEAEIARQAEVVGSQGQGQGQGQRPASEIEPDTDSDNDADNENDTENETDDEETDKTTLTPKIVTQPPSSTLKYTNVLEEWAVVTGNVSDLPARPLTLTPVKETETEKVVKVTESDTKTEEVAAAVTEAELPAKDIEAENDIETESQSDDAKSEGAKEETNNATETPEKPSEQTKTGPEAEVETVVANKNKEVESEEDDDEAQKETTEVKPNVTGGQQVKANVSDVLNTLKTTTFQKEWAIVTGEEVLSDPQARASCECGKVPFSVPGGGVNEWPWTGAIVRNGLFAGGRPHCGATLINNKYALTSAHCMDGLLPDRTELWLTVHDNLQNSGSSSGTLKLPVSRILMHPNYNRNSRDNDIALVGLVESINIGDNHYFVPACVPAGTSNYQGVMGKMAAWSTSRLDYNNNRLSNNELCRADMPILSNEVCNRDTSHTGRISSNMICAGYITPSSNSKCVGDAGGGLVIANGGRHTLIGVTSFGYTPNRAYSPTVHTRVSEYAEWILHNTRDADWCE